MSFPKWKNQVASLNKIILVGTVAGEPEARLSVDGIAITKFKIEVNSYPGSAPSIIDVVAWRKLAETCGQYLKKNKVILVEGEIHVRSFEDQSGQRKWVTEVTANNMQMLDSKQPVPVNAEPGKNEEVFDDVEELPEGDLPF
ncbi:MAG: single-strand DNA-binding protein [Candidatus Saganbacteria bacterium]|uniref:Single-stranded DNA-binding protein n=1 Tax=Candidatus Saganbacteria bacterium TaxID=2575572 RepID=A0A833KZL2_UNCSA|nr:MAG: single-strand DNA-binding protein [Candidatus Saganbacteria bacterium]